MAPMILREEIEAKAKEFEIKVSNVERDYVFGWLLYGIFTHSSLKDAIFLKGGNALRKGYFANTRYSADLDFGIPDDIDSEVLLQEINNICGFIQSKSGVDFVLEKNSVEEKFPPGENSPLPDLRVWEVGVFFKDFYGNPDKFSLKISMDLTRFDKTIYDPVTVPLIHPYSDAGDVVCNIRCMKLEEIIATKLKCLMQRQKAPDLFDYAYSIQLMGGTLNKEEVRHALLEKTIFDRNPYLLKGILASTDFNVFRAVWGKTIVCAKAFMLEVESAISVFIEDLEHIFSGDTDNGYAQFAYFPVEARTKIFKAARTKTRLKVVYKGDERMVEVYALKYMQPRGRDPKEYLYVYNCSGGGNAPGWRQFVSENLQSIENTDDVFEPQYPIELSKAGETPENPYLFDPNKPTKAPRVRRVKSIFSSPARRRVSSFSGGLKYSYQCSVCGKKFTKRSMDSTIGRHKSKGGYYDCSGTFGVYLGTKY